jgi:group I intron endonuclease
MDEKIICIYTILSPVGKIYIGSTCDFKRRMREHSKCSGYRKLCNSIKKHGWDLHQVKIIHVCDIEELTMLEISYKELLIKNFGWERALFMNIDDSGSHFRTENFKEKMKHLSIENWKKNPSSMGMSGKKHNNISNEKRVSTKIKNGTINHTNDTKNKISKANKGKKHSELSITKMSLAKKGKKFSEERKNSLRKPKGPQKIITCPICLKQGGNSMKRWHFENCKINK